MTPAAAPAPPGPTGFVLSSDARLSGQLVERGRALRPLAGARIEVEGPTLSQLLARKQVP